MSIAALTLTTSEVRAAVEALEGARFPKRTFTDWRQKGIVAPSVSTGRFGRTAIWSLRDVALVRLIVHLRAHGIPFLQVQAIIEYLGPELREVMSPRGAAQLIVDTRRAYIRRPGAPAIAVPSGQLMLDLDLRVLWKGLEAAARRAAA